jgi:hypothetical protein
MEKQMKCKRCDEIFEIDIDEELIGCEDFLKLNLCYDCHDEDEEKNEGF